MTRIRTDLEVDFRTDGPPILGGSADPAFRGDRTRWNPEQLFVASLAQCHMLWYLSLAASQEITVTAYRDNPTGTMVEESDGSGRFIDIHLHPHVTITSNSDPTLARTLHHRVADYCFIARSVAVPVHHEPHIVQPAYE
ncbi:OsmC family protein [Nocardia vermiculata]|uniref:Osmotically inducible protein C n=1 Tax=Nocardia vermiculata TaxID=257274 RepID=A0A846Y8V0_9NOCA|nr:OsmC family protein [Nocardia vermiculata]NKY54272.1 osmotically inducible protein C [Nocardia vermiculata]